MLQFFCVCAQEFESDHGSIVSSEDLGAEGSHALSAPPAAFWLLPGTNPSTNIDPGVSFPWRTLPTIRMPEATVPSIDSFTRLAQGPHPTSSDILQFPSPSISNGSPHIPVPMSSGYQETIPTRTIHYRTNGQPSFKHPSVSRSPGALGDERNPRPRSDTGSRHYGRQAIPKGIRTDPLGTAGRHRGAPNVAMRPSQPPVTARAKRGGFFKRLLHRIFKKP